MSDIQNEPKEYYVTRKFGLFTGLSLIPLFFLLAYLGARGRALAITMCMYTFICTARSRWELRRHPWFWMTLITLAILHAPLFVFIPWPAISPGMALAPIWYLDFAILYGCIKLAEKIWSEKKSNSVADT